MNLEEVKRVGPSYPQDIDWGFQAFCKYLEKHPRVRDSWRWYFDFRCWSFFWWSISSPIRNLSTRRGAYV